MCYTIGRKPVISRVFRVAREPKSRATTCYMCYTSRNQIRKNRGRKAQKGPLPRFSSPHPSPQLGAARPVTAGRGLFRCPSAPGRLGQLCPGSVGASLCGARGAAVGLVGLWPVWSYHQRKSRPAGREMRPSADGKRKPPQLHAGRLLNMWRGFA